MLPTCSQVVKSEYLCRFQEEFDFGTTLRILLKYRLKEIWWRFAFTVESYSYAGQLMLVEKTALGKINRVILLPNHQGRHGSIEGNAKFHSELISKFLDVEGVIGYTLVKTNQGYLVLD